MTAAKQKRTSTDILTPVEAIAAAFNDIEDLDCINLMQGRRVDSVMSTGSLALDLLLGGGIARGRMATFAGPEASGKSTLLQQCAISAQALDIPVVYYDHESGADPVYMRTQGLDIRRTMSILQGGKSKALPAFSYTQPDTGDQVYKHILATLSYLPDVSSGTPTLLFLIDSFAAMSPAEIDQSTGEGARLGARGRMHSYWLSLIIPKIARKGAVLLGTNQMRANIGGYGNFDQEAAGNAIKFYSHYKIRTSKKQVDQDPMKVQTLPVVWRTVKNKSFPPFRSTDNRLILGRGIDKAYDTHYFLTQIGALNVESGRRRVMLGSLSDKLLDWKSFRYLTENPKFRSKCFELLRDNDTFRRYFEVSKDSTYFYDAEYDYSDDVLSNMELSVKESAQQYEEEKKSRRKRGLRPEGKSVKEDNADLALEEQAKDEAADYRSTSMDD